MIFLLIAGITAFLSIVAWTLINGISPMPTSIKVKKRLFEARDKKTILNRRRWLDTAQCYYLLSIRCITACLHSNKLHHKSLTHVTFISGVDNPPNGGVQALANPNSPINYRRESALSSAQPTNRKATHGTHGLPQETVH